MSEQPKLGTKLPMHLRKGYKQPAPTPEPTEAIALCPFCNTMKWPSHQAKCSERPTPEPELNVEAEMLADIISDLMCATADAYHGDLAKLSDKASDIGNLAHAEIFALIQQVSDQRVREFSEQLSKRCIDMSDHYVGRWGVPQSDIDQILSDYLTHKEQSDERP